MNIPEEAVEAAAREAYGHPWDNAPEWAKQEARRIAREHLEAAAPFIAAQALRDAADTVSPESEEISADAYEAGEQMAADRVRVIANQLDPQ